MNLFIDTNIYLSFYHFSSEDLESLRKLVTAIQNGSVILWLPEQVVDEFKRNREAKISDALKQFSEQKLPKIFPQFFKDYDEYSSLVGLSKEYRDVKKILFEKLDNDIKTNSLRADEIIDLLFDKARKLKVTKKIFNKAKLRFEKGNPPGKNSSYGDAINWELLLKNIPENEDLQIVAVDKDYVSVLDNKMLSEFLSTEWFENKKSKIGYYSSLSEYFKDFFPGIKLASELEKKFAINRLTNSSNFQSTHTAISKLLKYTDYSPSEVLELVDALLTNTQLTLIAEDEDVNIFAANLIKTYGGEIDSEKLEKLIEIYMPVDFMDVTTD